MASFNAVCFWKETNKSWQDLAFQAFNDPKSINREASETTLPGVTLGGWNALLTSGLLGGEWCHGGFKLFFYCAVVCFLFRPFILICHDHCCCRTTSRMLKRPYCGQEHWLPGRWPLFKTNVISKWCFCHYATCSTQSNLVYSTCCIISKQSTKHVFSFLFFHDLWSKVSIYTPNNEASWKGRITIPPLASIKKTLPAGLRDRHLVCSLQCAGGSMASFLARRASVVNVGKSFWLFEIVVCCLAAWSFCHCYIYVSAESNVLIHVL